MAKSKTLRFVEYIEREGPGNIWIGIDEAGEGDDVIIWLHYREGTTKRADYQIPEFQIEHAFASPEFIADEILKKLRKIGWK